MKRKFYLIFSVIIGITFISFFFSSSSLKGHHREGNAINSNKIVLVNLETPPNCNSSASNDKTKIENEKKQANIDYLRKYPHFLECKNEYSPWKQGLALNPPDIEFNFTAHADPKYHDIRFIRAVLVYFPITSVDYYQEELKWLYRSWIHMLKFEPAKWRTDLIIFVENDPAVFNNSEFFMNQLNCKFTNLRKSSEQKPMCTLMHYVALKKRTFDSPDRNWPNSDDRYQYLLRNVSIFKNDAKELDTFYKLMKQSLSEYGYLDSILMAFEG